VRSPYLPTVLDTVVKADAIEPIEVDTILPTNLDEYDALFLESNFPLDSVSQILFVHYIDSGGKLFMVGLPIPDSSQPLAHRLGITGFAATGLDFLVNSVHGTNGFTENIFDSLPLDTYESGYGGPGGSITPVLVADGGGWMVQPIAYIAEDTSIRVVLYEGVGDEVYPGNYYSEFISDVVCNYFNLCAEYVQPTPQIASTDIISIVHDSRDRGYSISADITDDGDVSVDNSLGVVVWHANVQAGENLVELPLSLRNGLYFVSLRSGDKINFARFAVVN
jgi:hypothetical protein